MSAMNKGSSPYLSCFLIIFTSLAAILRSVCAGKAGSPVVLVPGDGGNQLLAKLDKPSSAHFWCKKFTKDYFTIWLNLEELLPLVQDCFVDNMRLFYNSTTQTTSNSPGVDIVVPGFGNTSSVEYLDPSRLSQSAYFAYYVDSMVRWGYTRNLNVRGAPFDFRKAPNEASHFFKRLVLLIEETYRENNNERIVLIAHSMGNLYTLFLLQQQSRQWKDKYIKSLIALSAPWGGAVKLLRVLASGENLGIPVINPVTVRTEQRASPANIWLLPYDSFWGPDEVLVSRPGRNYTIRDFKQFFDDLDYPQGWFMRQDTENLLGKLDAPNVEVHCLHGIGVPTSDSFIYRDDQWPDSQPTVVSGDGDGTVNRRSLLGCLRWSQQQDKPVMHRSYKTDHSSILQNREVLDYIKHVLYN